MIVITTTVMTGIDIFIRRNSMADLGSMNPTWAPRALSVLRVIAAFLFMQHGAQKLYGFLAAQTGPAPEPFSTIWIAGVLELFGGLLLLLGLFTRPVAFILSGLMAVAYFMAHAPQGFWALQNRGELAALYSFLFLYIAVAGGGAWSLDRLLRRDKASTNLAANSEPIRKVA
jgi:putative oxidoreductase